MELVSYKEVGARIRKTGKNTFLIFGYKRFNNIQVFIGFAYCIACFVC
jgi:hypothetical protein